MNNAKGLIEIAPKARDYLYELACGAPTATEYPEFFQIADDRLGVVKDQGMVGACVGEVVAQLAEIFNYIETGENIEFSEGFAYGGLREPEDRYYGMFLGKTLEQWRKKGMIPKLYLPELIEMNEMQNIVNANPKLFEIAKPYKINSYVSLRGSKAKKDLLIKDALTKYNYGLMCSSSEYFGEPHCIMLIGWNDKTDSYIIKNSWGKSYGENGIKEIPKSEINEIYLVLDEVIELKFVDVKETDWFYKYVKNTVMAGLMEGTSETTFEPNKQLTRAEAAALMDRIVKLIDDRVEILTTKINNLKN